MKKFVIDEATGCWNWIACIAKNTGYGLIGNEDRKLEGAHRVSWRLFNGAIPQGLFICHRCDNRRCVNPKHLFLGGVADNHADMDAKGRRADRRGEAHPLARLTAASVVKIRERLAAGEMQRSIAVDFGVTRSQIAMIKTGRSWRP